MARSSNPATTTCSCWILISQPKSLTNLIFPDRKVIAENRTSYYKALIGLDSVEIGQWLNELKHSVLRIDRSREENVINIQPYYYSKEQQSKINNSLFLLEYRNHNLNCVVERFSQFLASLGSRRHFL